MRGRYAPQDNPGVLKKDWIREALNKFTNLGLAKKNLKNNYQIDIKRTIKKPTNFLLDLKFNPKQDKDSSRERRKKVDRTQITIDNFMDNSSIDKP